MEIELMHPAVASSILRLSKGSDMSYVITRRARIGAATHERVTLADAVSLAMEFIGDGSPGTQTSIAHIATGQTFSEAEIRHLAADMPPPRRSMFDDGDA